MYPVTGPLDVPSNNDTTPIHYTADDDLIDGDPGEHASQLPAYLRSIQKSYVLSRGYSVGYLFAVDWLGGIWQLRGWEYQSAANRGWNERTFPILMLVDGQDGATPEAIKSANYIIAEAQRRSGRRQAIVGHYQIGQTQCPGAGLKAQLAQGLFRSTPWTPEPTGGIVTTTKSEWQQARIADVVFTGDTFVEVPQAKGKKAVTVTLTAVTPGMNGWLVAFFGPQPPTSSLNFTKGETNCNTVTVPVDANGWFAMHCPWYVRVIVDLVGVHS